MLKYKYKKNYDTLSEMCVSINRGVLRNQYSILCFKSKLNLYILKVLFQEGLISGYQIKNNKIQIFLKYFFGHALLKKINLISTNTRPIYINYSNLKKKYLYNNKNIDGILILSTIYGLLTHQEALLKKIGGKIICKILC